MRTNDHKTIFRTSLAGIAILLLAVGVSFAQTVNLAAGPTTVTLPDGSTVPMWGYNCGTPVAGSTATCSALNPNASGKWSPVVITVPVVSSPGPTTLTINFTNNLTFTPPTPTGGPVPPANNIPTSLVIVGQVGGGLGTSPTYVASPVHSQQQTTWPIANTGAVNNPPPQGPRVQSFATEVAVGTPQSLTWNNLRPGTYLLESGTHPSIQVPMGLIGMLVVTTAPSASGSPATETAAGTAYPGVSYDAEIPLEFSEIDPIQNNAVNAAVNTAGFSEMMVWSGQPNGCGNSSSPTYQQCYPPAVNYTPLYYLINGVPFSKTNASASQFNASNYLASPPTTGANGSILVRLVNAGLRMHVPSIVGSLTGAAAVPGFSILAEDGNLAPGLPKVQSDVFMAAGKTFDVMVNAPASGASALAVFDRELSLSGNASERDAGITAYLSINGSNVPAAAGFGAATARPDTYNSLVAGQTLIVADVSKGVLANDTNVYGVQLDPGKPAQNGTVTLNTNGTFMYVPAGTATADSFGYCANGAASGTPGMCTTVTLGASSITNDSITCTAPSYTSSMATYLAVKTPGVLAGCKDAANLALTVATSTIAPSAGLAVTPDANGGFNASVSAAGSYTFTFQAKNSQGTLSSPVTVTLTFPQPSNLAVTVKDPQSGAILTDYRWIIEEDKTFYVNPNCTTTTTTAQPGCPTWSSTNGVPPTFGVNFHTSHMEYVSQGCTGQLSCEAGQSVLGVPMACNVGDGACTTPDPGTGGWPAVSAGSVALDAGCGFGSFAGRTCTTNAPYPKRYYLSVLPGDAANPFNTANAVGGHTMGGAPITWNASTNSWNPVTVLVEPTPLPPGKLSVQVFEDDFPLNGEQDAGGGIDVIASNEPGLGGFNIILWDDMGGSGDVTGQMTYDMFNQPLSNSLAGTIDPATGFDACPISPQITANTTTGDGTQQGITGMIVTCPKYESDGATESPLAGQAVVANLMPGRFSVQAIPGADRIARGEEWLQTNTLDGQHPHDSFIRVGEPNYFQEYGPAGFHVSIGFANPAIIQARHTGVCNGTDLNLTAPNCTNTVTGRVTAERMSRTPDERLYSSGSRDAFYWTQCFVSLGDPDGEDFMFTKCDANGNFTFTGVPTGSWRLSIFDQWNDQLMDGLSTPVNVANGNNQTVTMGDVPVQQWQANVYTRTFVDDNKDGVYESNELGIPFLNTTVRYRDGSRANFLLTDFTGVANFNETFPLFNWYVVETDTTRYKTTGIHTVYDAGGPADGTTCGGNYPPCGPAGTPYTYLANTVDQNPLPTNLSVPGAVYCSTADCSTSAASFQAGTPVPSSSSVSTGRIDPPWVAAEGWQGFSGQNNFIEFGKAPYAPGENGGIYGHVVYSSTRPFDDPQMNVQQPWEPLVPHVTINLYQEGFASDGVTPTLTLADTTQTSSWDDWAQGFRSDGMPNMNCPGQGNATSGPNQDLFFYTLFNQPNYLDLYNYYYNGGTLHGTNGALPYNSQYKCYDGMHNWNQLQPAPYDGMYSFPSVTGINPTTGKPTGTNCTICTTNPDTSDPWRVGTPMLPAGKYVVEVVLPPGYELVKEEDKNILIGDNFIAPVTQEFGGLGNIFIMPDQASVASAYDPSGSGYNQNNFQNQTQSLGASPNNQIVPGFLEPVWPCVGEARIVPDYISLYPQSAEVSPFAGATRHLCDRKEVTLGNQMGATAKFYIYTSTHIASKFTGGITDDFTSEFDPFAPVFGEKFSPPNMPVSVKDWAGNETSRVYSDQWGMYNGLTYSTWEVNPPNPTGYSPTMMVQCMNDKGPIPGPNGTMITDPLFNPLYSQFCYELPYMPGQTDYLDTPVVPTAAFVGAGYNNPDCSYPTLTPAIASVTSSDVAGPWASTAGGVVTAINLTNDGAGYTSAPSVTISGGGGSGASATAVISGSVSSLTLLSHGSGYSSAPTVSFSGGGGSGAAATAALGFPVATVSVANGGSGYTSRPSATFSAPAAGGTTAAAATFLKVTAIVPSSPGSGYTSRPTVTISGGGGSGAAATAVMKVGSATVTNGGSGYTSAPSVSITGGGGSGATATATISNSTHRVTAVNITNGGSGYTSQPTITFSGGGGSSAAATAFLNVLSVTVTANGSGYTGRPSATFSGGGGSGANAANGATTGTFLSLSSLTLSNPGNGYTAVPTVTITAAPAGGTNATASATLGAVGGVYALTLNNGGTGYSSAPSVSLSGGGGSGASATDRISASVVAVNVTNGGSGYTGTPTVSIANPACTLNGTTCVDATATASVPPGSTLTITALGDQTVGNYGYSGPASTAAPFNAKTITRHYGFGGTQGTVALVGSDGVSHSLTNVSWNDTTITGTVPGGLPACAVQQQVQYGGPSVMNPAQCGQLVITTSTGQQSIDTVTVTIGGKKPSVLAGGQTIQSALDAATPGDMIIVPPGTYKELLLMWKPVRLQGVGAASTIIDASTHPAGTLKLDPWRRSVNCLFGLALNGQPSTGNVTISNGSVVPGSGGSNPYDPAGTFTCPNPSNSSSGATGPDGNTWTYLYGGPNFPTMAVDRVPLEGILGWDATVNGNLAEQLQEPSLMGAYEGAGITVLAKGVNIPAGSTDVFGSGAEATFPTGTTLLTGFVGPAGGALLGDLNPMCHTSLFPLNLTNPYPGNFMCNPSSIDGLTVTDASQGGGGMFVHAWAHNLQIANNRVFNNAGTLSGGVSIGQGESPEAYLNGTTSDSDPGSCFTPLPGQTTTPLFPTNTQLPYCMNLNVNLHNNAITNNSSTGDELFSGTPAGAGGVSICTGADFYKFNNNWICGNLSTGDGGGVGHMGFSWNGTIANNTFLFNQSTNPSIQSNGGGLIVMGAAPDASVTVNGVATECGSVTDNDCVPGLSDGTGPGLQINANLFQGNSADAGSGGGIRLQAVNGTDVARFPSKPANWYQVQITNNIIANNVAGWDGAGVSLEDSLAVTLTNNTIASNDTTASSGVLFNTLGAPLASSQSPAPTCITQSGGTASCPQPAGLVSMQNSPQMTSSFTTGAITCPPGNYAPGTSPTNGSCIHVSYPALYNNIFWQNRTFDVTVGPMGSGTQNQQNVVTLYNAFSNTVAASQSSTGACPSGSSYWDIGVRNDTGPTNHGSGFTLNPLFGVLTNTTGYSNTNSGSNPMAVSQYCNGSRVPPENGGLGWQVPPGIADAVVPNPIFSLTPTATVDEGNNWINISWGPLSMVNPVSSTAASNVFLGNYALQSTSPAINAITCSSTGGGVCTETLPAGSSGVTTIQAPATDFFGNKRPDTGNHIDMGAVEVPGH